MNRLCCSSMKTLRSSMISATNWSSFRADILCGNLQAQIQLGCNIADGAHSCNQAPLPWGAWMNVRHPLNYIRVASAHPRSKRARDCSSKSAKSTSRRQWIGRIAANKSPCKSAWLESAANKSACKSAWLESANNDGGLQTPKWSLEELELELEELELEGATFHRHNLRS